MSYLGHIVCARAAGVKNWLLAGVKNWLRRFNLPHMGSVLLLLQSKYK
jgi:hypothetical protein